MGEMILLSGHISVLGLREAVYKLQLMCQGIPCESADRVEEISVDYGIGLQYELVGRAGFKEATECLESLDLPHTGNPSVLDSL